MAKSRRTIYRYDLPLRQPHHRSELQDFIESLGGEIPYLEAVVEFQNEWCDHPRSQSKVIATKYEPSDDEYHYEVKCAVCGLIRQKRGRAPLASFG